MAHPCPQVPPTAGTALQAVLTECHCSPRHGLHTHASAPPDTPPQIAHAHMRVHIHARTHAQPGTGTAACIKLRVCARACASRHVYTAGAPTRACTHVLTCGCRGVHACVPTGACTHLRSGTLTRVRSSARTHTQRYTRSRGYSHRGVGADTDVHLHTRICTRTQGARIRAGSHARSNEGHEPALTPVPA